MTGTVESPSFNDILTAYERIPEKITAALARAPADKLEIRCAGSQMSLRETVHHIVEANIVAASMLIAALGSDRATYDWSWLWPGRDWCDRMRYDAVPLDAAITTLNGLIRHIVNMINVRPDAAERKVSVHDLPGETLYFRTIPEILHQEAKHVDEHLAEIMSTLEAA
jgi:hypothetical protein